ncbi:MAG: cytochrome c [Planctomycetota bacterium]
MRCTAPFIALGALACLTLVGVGCRGEFSEAPPRQFLPDLDDQPKYKPQGTSEFFAEFTDDEGHRYGRNQRLPVTGTVAYGKHTSPLSTIAGVDFGERSSILQDDDRVYLGKNADGSWVERIPASVASTEEEFARLFDMGRENYNIYCMPCHSATGDGLGLVGTRWAYPVPSYHQDQYRFGGEKGQDGYLFHVIRNGVANVGGSYELKMPGYARKVSHEESWAIVYYMRALQRNQAGSLDDLPQRQRDELNRRAGNAGGEAEVSS